jgi:CRP/FNR family transcriptional regulator, cyclic AMP receptor protein
MASQSDIQKESYQAGSLIFCEGDLDFHFYIVETGEVQIFTKTKTGKRINICKVRQGESFGEFALLSKQARTASAEAITPVKLVKVSQAGYEELLNDLPVWASSMMKSFIERFRNVNELLKSSEQFLPRK